MNEKGEKKCYISEKNTLVYFILLIAYAIFAIKSATIDYVSNEKISDT